MKRFHSLNDADFESLFRDFEHHAFRLETLQVYNVDYEKKPFQDFLAGKERYAHPTQQEWVDGIRANAAAGKTMARVHVVEEPPTDYVRFEMLWPYQDSLPAGEDIRIWPVEQGKWPVGVLDFDYWLFDSEIAYTMQYYPDGSFSSADLVTDPAEVKRLEQCMVRATSGSMHLEEYLSSRVA